MSYLKPALWGGLLALCISVPAWGQVELGPQQRIGAVQTNTAYFYYAKQGALTHQVYVLGDVRPGIYEVGQGTTLAELYVMASSGVGQQQTQYQRRETTIRLYRETEGGRSEEHTMTRDDLLTQARYDVALADGDTVTVTTVTRQRFSWRDALSVGTAAAAIALAVDRLFAN